MPLVIKLNPSCADSRTEESVCKHAEGEEQPVRRLKVSLQSCSLHTSSTSPTPPARLGVTEMLLTFLLDFIRQIGTVRQTTATEYLPENGKNRRGDLPAGSVGIGEEKKKNRQESLEPSSPSVLLLSSRSRQQQISMSHN